MYAAVDIGGTKTLIATFTHTGELREQIKFPTPRSYHDFKIELAKSVEKLTTQDFQAVGVAAPGEIDHKRGWLLRAGNLGWKNEHIQADIEKILSAPAVIENDAKAAALSESKLAGPKYSKVVYITISTGINIGLCVDGILDRGIDQAEAGWMMIEHNGSMVPWEKVASGKAIVSKYGKRASELDDPVAWKDISRVIAKGLISVIAITQPDLIVVGGGVGAHLEKFQEPLMSYLKTYESPLVPIPPIHKAKHPEEAVIYGCFELARS